MTYQWNFDFLWQMRPLLLQGLANTAKLWLVALSCGLLIGLVMGIFRTAPSRTLRTIGTFYVETIRNTPGMVQLIWFYFALPILTGMQSSAWVAASVSLAIYTGAYSAEIYRAGIVSIENGQWEAARALGFGYRDQMRYVILPQAFRIAIAPTVGFSVQVIKGTALASIIGFVDLTKAGTMLNNATFRPFLVYSLVALIYFCLCFPLSWYAHRLERQLHVAR